MFGRERSRRQFEDSIVQAEQLAMRLVEEILEAAARHSPIDDQDAQGRRPVAHALSLCVCATKSDVPNWLIHDDADGEGLAWCRTPAGDVEDLVDPRRIAGGHTEPEIVLSWLRGEASEPFWDDGETGDVEVLQHLGAKIRASQT